MNQFAVFKSSHFIHICPFYRIWFTYDMNNTENALFTELRQSAKSTNADDLTTKIFRSYKPLNMVFRIKK